MKKKERRVILYEKHAGPYFLFAWCNFGVQRKLMVNNRGGARAPLRWKVLVLCFQSQLPAVRSVQWNGHLRGPKRTPSQERRRSQRYCAQLAHLCFGLRAASREKQGWRVGRECGLPNSIMNTVGVGRVRAYQSEGVGPWTQGVYATHCFCWVPVP